MMKVCVLALLAVSQLLCLGGRASGQLYLGAVSAQERIPDARSQAMAGAYTSVAEGPTGAWWNPGALGIRHPWGVVPYSKMKPDIAYRGNASVLGFALSGMPKDIGFGLQYTTVDFGEYATGPVEKESAAIAGLGFDLLRRLELQHIGGVHWGLGGAVRYVRVEQESGLGRKPDASSWDVDFGTLFRARIPLEESSAGGAEPAFAGVRTGLVVRNALNRRIKRNETGDGAELVQSIRAGLALEVGTKTVPPFGPAVSGIITAEMINVTTWGFYEPVKSYGFECGVLDVLFFRWGRVNDDTFRIYETTYGVGFGVSIPEVVRVQVDWAKGPEPGDVREANQVTLSVTRVPKP